MTEFDEECLDALAELSGVGHYEDGVWVWDDEEEKE